MIMKKSEREFIEKIKHGGTHSFFKRAIELGVKVAPLADQPKVVRLSMGSKRVYVRTGSIPVYKMMGQLTKNKSITKSILSDVGIEVPRGIVLEKAKDFKKSMITKNKLRYPLIVKPQNSSRAKGVTWDIKNAEEAKKAVTFSEKESDSPIIIEEMFLGEEYRVLVYKGKFISAVHKIPPTLYGDGSSDISQLIKIYNLPRAKERYLKIDDVLKKQLKQAGYSLNSILEKNQKLKVKNTFLMSEGARLVSANKDFNRTLREICQKSATILNLQLGGVDIIINKEKKPFYVILEVNPNPFYNMHEKELIEGDSFDVSRLILNDLFPELKKHD